MSERRRGCGATHCYGCICDTCANSVELLSWYFTMGEGKEPCFNCDECRHYDGDIKKDDKWTNSCPRRIEAKKAIEARKKQEDRRAQEFRKRFKVINGGR